MNERFTGFRELLGFRAESGLPALRYERAGALCTLSYRELCGLVLERKKLALKEEAGRVLIATAPSPETVVSIFAHVLAGQDVVLADPSASDELLRAMAEGVQAEAAEAEDELLEVLKPCLAAPSGERREDEGRLLFFTSGTSERAKAVVLSSCALSLSAWNGQCMLPCGEGDVLLSVLPLAHVFGFVCSLLWGLAYGACVALGRGARYLFSDCAYFHPTILPAVPALLEALLARGALNPELRTVLVGAAPCRAQTLRAAQAKGISVRFGYGLTETASGLAISTEDDDPFSMMPCPDTKLFFGPDGEILVRTPCLMEGYFGRRKPARGGKFHTGDLGYLDERGGLHITGRKKEILVLPGGTKLFCPECERELQALLPGAEIAVALRDRRPALLYAGDCTQEQAQAAADRYNRSRPRGEQLALAVRWPGKLPRTATGKLKRWMLEEKK